MKLFGRIFGEKEAKIVEHALGADHVIGYGKKQEELGKVTTSYSWTARLPHPDNMGTYEKWAHDPEANMAINVLTDIITPGYYTEMSDDVPEDQRLTHPNKIKVDEYGEAINLDEDLSQIVNQKLAKGFCPTEKIRDSNGQLDLKILPSENFYIWRTTMGEIIRYTQENTLGNIIASWEKKDWQSKVSEAHLKTIMKSWAEADKDVTASIDDIIPFYHRQTPMRPYGFSLLEPIGNLIDGRNDLNKDVIKGVHRWANPIPIMETSKSKDNSEELKKSITDRDVDEWILAYDIEPEELRWNTLTVDPAARFIPYVELIYYQICEGLHAPLLLYLKNATEASATVMMESVDRLINGIQRYVKRRVERYLFEPLVGKPTPRLMWGKPQTGLEKVTMTELAALCNSPALANNQKQELLKQYGVKLPEADWKSGPQLQPFTPFGQDQKKPFDKTKQEPPAEMLIEKLNDLNTGLNIIATNFDEGKLPITAACQMAERTIKVHMQRAYPNDWESKTQEEFQRFVSERIMKHGKPSYRVTVD